MLTRPFLEDRGMKPDIHPEYGETKVACSCGNEFTTQSTLGKDLQVEVCSACHPFYTGKSAFVDAAGRVEKFQSKFKGDYFKNKKK